jgi:hypothetical protein
MSALRTIIAATILGVAALAGAAGAGVPVKPPVTPPRPLHLCLTHYETDFIEGAGKVLYFIDSRCQKHFVRFILS